MQSNHKERALKIQANFIKDGKWWVGWTDDVQRESTVLGVLRVAEVVRYQADGKRNRYRLKHPGEVRGILSVLGRFVKSASTVRS